MENKRYKISSNFALSKVSGEAVILPVSDSVDNLGNLYVINETAEFVIERISKGMNVEEIVVDLMNEYDVDRDRAMANVVTLVEGFVERGFLEEL